MGPAAVAPGGVADCRLGSRVLWGTRKSTIGHHKRAAADPSQPCCPPKRPQLLFSRAPSLLFSRISGISKPRDLGKVSSCNTRGHEHQRDHSSRARVQQRPRSFTQPITKREEKSNHQSQRKVLQPPHVPGHPDAAGVRDEDDGVLRAPPHSCQKGAGSALGPTITFICSLPTESRIGANRGKIQQAPPRTGTPAHSSAAADPPVQQQLGFTLL